MAKQTFTTGQVLTAAQMTSLQQTAMGGGSATAKTATYVLVAADAGTTVAMNAAGATTITVNTSLFAAGDTVYIQNLGAGVTTITAGTATVNTSATLALAQYEGGQLYFNSTSAAIFIKGAGSGGGGLTLINSPSGTSLTGNSVTIGSIPQTYKELYVWFENISGATDEDMAIRLNADTAGNYLYAFTRGTTSQVGTAGTSFLLGSFSSASSRAKNTFGQLRLPLYTETSGIQSGLCNYYSGYHEVAANGQVAYSKSAAITSITFVALNTTFDAGTAYVYGVS